jgi:hypothetical protein
MRHLGLGVSCTSDCFFWHGPLQGSNVVAGEAHGECA